MKAQFPVDPSAGGKPRISYAVARLQQLVLAAVSERTASHGLTALQFTTLSVLDRHGAPLSNSQLARRSFMTPQSMHEVIYRLEGEGLIKRSPHPDHHRKLPARLTEKGRHVLAACESAIAVFEGQMLRGFGKADRQNFLGMITSAVRNLGGGFTEIEVGEPAEEESTRPRARPAKRRA